jgi:hypothetical protein
MAIDLLLFGSVSWNLRPIPKQDRKDFQPDKRNECTISENLSFIKVHQTIVG